jgi:hypothetical protein
VTKILLTLAIVCAAAPAWSTPRPLPFTYTAETLGKGDLEVEQSIDATPTQAISTGTGTAKPYLATQFQTEFEYGILDNLELGLYLTLVPDAGNQFANSAQLMEANGSKQRLRWRLADIGAWPVDVDLYGEVTENTREIELEAKIILQRRIVRGLKAVVNLWGEREYYYAGQQEWVLNPTAGLTYEITPMFQPGIEYWMRAEFPDGNAVPKGFSAFNLGPNHYLGPTMLLNFGKLWWSSGVYLRLNDLKRSPTVDPSVPADAYGVVWVRTVIGLSL